LVKKFFGGSGFKRLIEKVFKYPAAADTNGLFKKLFNFRRRRIQTVYLKSF